MTHGLYALPAALWVVARRARISAAPLAHGRGSTLGRGTLDIERMDRRCCEAIEMPGGSMADVAFGRENGWSGSLEESAVT